MTEGCDRRSLGSPTRDLPQGRTRRGASIGFTEAAVSPHRGSPPCGMVFHDEPTADLLTQRLQVHEKTAWMLRSLLT